MTLEKSLPGRMAFSLATNLSYATNPSKPTPPQINGDRILPDVQGYTAFPLLRAKRIPAKDPVTMMPPPQSVFLMAVQTDDCLGGASRHHAKPTIVGTHIGRLIQKTLCIIISHNPCKRSVPDSQWPCGMLHYRSAAKTSDYQAKCREEGYKSRVLGSFS